jgi:UDP-glucuronate 4-epimerase
MGRAGLAISEPIGRYYFLSNTILVTGAAGFIGSHVAEALLSRGDRVLGIDNLNPYYALERKRANLAEVMQALTDGARFVFIEADVRDRTRVQELFEQNSIHAIVHLAAMAGVRASLEQPNLYYDVNLIGTINLLEAARKNKTGNFVFASTSSVYGDTKQIPFVETDVCDRPLAPYAASKRAAEQIGFTFHHLFGMNFTALRFFTVYGPRNRPDMMAFKVADNIFFNREVPLYNAGQVRRDWTFVTDIVEGVLAALDRPLGYEVINLGRGEPILLSDLVHLIEEQAGRKAHFVPAPIPETDMVATCADISKARRLLGYQPKTSMHTGVASFWQWYKKKVLRI